MQYSVNEHVEGVKQSVGKLCSIGPKPANWLIQLLLVFDSCLARCPLLTHCFDLIGCVIMIMLKIGSGIVEKRESKKLYSL